MINYRVDGDVAILQLDDGKANVFSIGMSDALSENLKRAEQEAKATVLVGRDGQFSAGYDLAVMQSNDPKAMIEMVVRGFEVLYQVASHPRPLIAACSGNAMGLGAFMLLVSDTRLAGDAEFKICLPETRGGMSFPPILVAAARGRLNQHKFVEAALQSKVYDPKGAIDAGFIDTVVALDQLEDTAIATAAEMAKLPTKFYGRNKLDLLADKLGAMRTSLEEIKANPAILAAAVG